MSEQIDRYHDLSPQKRANSLPEENVRANLEAWTGDGSDDAANADFMKYLETRAGNEVTVNSASRLYDRNSGKFVSKVNADKAHRSGETIDSILGEENFAIGGRRAGERVASKTRQVLHPETEQTPEANPDNASEDWDESQFSPLDLDRADVLLDRLRDAYDAGDAESFEKIANQMTELVDRMVNGKGVDPVNGRLVVKNWLNIISSYEAEGGLDNPMPAAPKVPEYLLERSRRRRAELDAAALATESPAKSESTPVKMTDESFMAFIANSSDDENKEGVEARYRLVKKWDMEHLLGNPTDAEAYAILSDDYEWDIIRKTAEQYGTFVVPEVEPKAGNKNPDVEPAHIPETDEARRARLAAAIELPKELTDQLDVLRDNYVKWSVNRSGRSAGKKYQLERVTADYNRARDAVSNKLVRLLKEAGANQEDILHFAKIAQAGESFKTTFLIKDAQVSQAENKGFKGFYDWWGRQQTGGEGFVGRIKESFKKGNRGKTALKIGAMGAITFIPALGIGAAAAVVAGSLIPGSGVLGGGLVGSLVGRGITKSQFSRKASKEAGAKNNAQIQEAVRLAKANAIIQAATSLDDLKQSLFTEGYNDVTEDVVKGNRKRLVGSVALGAVSGLAGGLVGSVIADQFIGSGPRASIDTRPGSSNLNPQDAAAGGPASDVPAAPRPPQTVVDLRPQTTAPTNEVIDLRPAAPAPAQIELPADFEANMPWTNAADVFDSPDPQGLIQNTLSEYNARSGHTFELRQDGMFWEGGRVINPAELAEYNRVMAEIMNRSLESDTLPAAA